MPTYLPGLQQAAEDFAKKQEENKKAHDTAIGNRKLYDQAVQAGMLDVDQQIQFNKGNDTTKNNILAGAMRAWDAQREMENQKMRQQAFQLDQGRYKMEQDRMNYKPGADVYDAAAASNLNVIPGAPGQGPTFHPYAPKTPTDEQMAAMQSQATSVGGKIISMPDGSYRFEKTPVPAAPPMPTVPVPRADGTTIDVPLSNPAAQEELKRRNPAAEAFSKFGARPEDFLPENIVQGEVPFNDPKKYAFTPAGAPSSDPKATPVAKTHVLLKNLDKAIPNADYSEWLRKFADAGQLDGPVTNPVTGEIIRPTQKPPTAAVNSRVLDPSNSASIAIMQNFIQQAGGDINAARAAAHQQGYIW